MSGRLLKSRYASILCSIALASGSLIWPSAGSAGPNLAVEPECRARLLQNLLSDPSRNPSERQMRSIISFASGHCRPENGIQATKLLRTAANANNPIALLILGLSYQAPIGEPSNRKRANVYFKRAALAGNLQAAHRLGLNMLRRPTSIDSKLEGLRWLRKAAGGGNTGSSALLAQIYSKGRFGFKVSPCRARAWRQRATADDANRGQLTFRWMNQADLCEPAMPVAATSKTDSKTVMQAHRSIVPTR